MLLLPVLVWLNRGMPKAAHADNVGRAQPTPTPTLSVPPDDVSCAPFATRNCTAADLEAIQASLAILQPQSAASEAGQAVMASSAPVINLWYGLNQPFGQLGNPQQWINVLGNISPTVGVTLTYSLNDGPAFPLSIGPDPTLYPRRLYGAGDFNVEIAITDVVSGPNQIVITATGSLSNTSVATVTVQYTSGNVWPEPYAIDRASVTRIQDVAQIVDGQWALQPDGIRPVVMAYDRVIAIGDMTWDDYEVTVPITIHMTDTVGANNPVSTAPGIGFVMRWQGHTDTPVVCPQPHCGWLPMGASGWYDWGLNGGTFFIGGDSSRLATDATGLKLELNMPYYWKMRVETMPSDQRTQYSFKVWKQTDPEPSNWLLDSSWLAGDVPNGSLLLVAHHVDATFGDVIIAPGPFTDTTAPTISDIQVTTQATSATVTWTTNEVATSQVDYGVSASYTGTVDNITLVTQHTLTLSGLTPAMTYHYRISSADAYGNAASSLDLTFDTNRTLFLPLIMRGQP